MRVVLTIGGRQTVDITFRGEKRIVRRVERYRQELSIIFIRLWMVGTDTVNYNQGLADIDE